MLSLDPGSKYVGSPLLLFPYEISDQRSGPEQKQRDVPVWAIHGQYSPMAFQSAHEPCNVTLAGAPDCGAAAAICGRWSLRNRRKVQSVSERSILMPNIEMARVNKGVAPAPQETCLRRTSGPVNGQVIPDSFWAATITKKTKSNKRTCAP